MFSADTPQQTAIGPVTPCGWLVEALCAFGVSLNEIEAHLERPVARDQLKRLILPSELYFRLFEWGAERLGNPDLGIEIAAQMTSREFGLLGYLLENSDTLGTWLENITTYHAVFSQDAEFLVTAERGIVALSYRPIAYDGVSPRQDICCTMGMIVRSISVATACGWQPLRCRLTMPRPENVSALENLLGPELQFEQDVNQVEISAQDRALAVPGADPVLFTILKEQADGILSTLSQEGELVSRLRLMITAHLSDGGVDTVRAACALNMSVRKLHRALGERGTSFRRLRKEVLREAARAHLADPDVPVTEIAHRLGFSETSAFTRAFKALEGVTPRDFRMRQLNRR